MVIQLTVCRGRQNTCTDCCSTVFKSCTLYIRPATRCPCWPTSLLKHRWGPYTFGIAPLITSYTYVLHPFKISYKRQSMKWSFYISTRAEVSCVSTILRRNAPGKVQVCYGAKEWCDQVQCDKTSRNHRGFQRFFHSFTSVQSSPSVLQLHQIYPCCLWVSCYASPSFVTKVLVLQFL